MFKINQTTGKLDLTLSDAEVTALVSDTYVPYTGATTTLNLGSQNFITTGTLGAGAITGTSITDSGLTQYRIPVAGVGGLLGDSADLTFDGSQLTTQTGTLGDELVTNGTFTGSATGWTLGTGWQYVSNLVRKNADGTGTLSPTIPITIVAGNYYTLTFTISNWTVGSVTPSIGGVILDSIGQNQIYIRTFKATATDNLIFTPTNTSRFYIDVVSVKQTTGMISGGGSLLLDGVVGGVPTSGAGTRLMWIPAKYAFRAGRVTSTQWNAENIGNYSVAFGYNTTASGVGSTASGYNENYDTTSFVAGTDTPNIGYGQVAMGYASAGNTLKAEGTASIAMGANVNALTNNYVLVFGKDFSTDVTQSFNIGFGQLDYEFTATQADFKDSILQLGNAIYLTQTDGNEYLDSLNDGYVDIGATTGIRLNSPLTRITGDLYVGNNADIDSAIVFDGDTNDGQIKFMEDEDYFESSSFIRTATSLYRRYYHLLIDAFNPGASGATWTPPSANTTGGYQLDAVGEVLYFDTDVHSDWDGVSDITVEIFFAVNVDNTGGGAGDTVDLKLVAYYNAVGDTACKTQTQEVATVVGQSAQYKVFKSTHTLNFDEVDNVIEAGDKIGFALNLETDSSEVDNIIILHGEYYYNTTHVGVESTDI